MYLGDCLKILPTLADKALISDLELGKAAEHLVCADLIMKGYRAYLSDQGLPYDIVIDLDGRLLRVQTKATGKVRPVPQRVARTDSYIWHVKRAGKAGKRSYGPKEFDLLALVAMDIKEIAYIPIKTVVTQTVILRPPNTPKSSLQRSLKNIDQYPVSEAIEVLL
jgi:hypothetical protein